MILKISYLNFNRLETYLDVLIIVLFGENLPFKRFAGLSKEEILKGLKYRLITYLTPYSKKILYLRKMESKAETIAKNKQISFPFRVRIIYEKGKSFVSIGFSYDYSKKTDGKFDIYIYSTLVMAPEEDILKTIFHEYGHFIYYHAPTKTLIPFGGLYFNNKFPKLTPTNDFVEDFCELFAYLILDLRKVDDILLKQIETARNEALLIMEKI
jgi:hypothetical protein